MEMQRDIAFKIVYFFILFIIGTIGLLYAYFKMSKKEQIEQERKARAKGVFFGEPSQQTFFDFLAGQNDPEASFSESSIFKSTTQSNDKKTTDGGFGANNLENLEEYQRPQVYNQ